MRSYFLSSTFSDMNFERDWFHEEVLPKFREAAHFYGEEADVIDLRIGIDTRELETPERLKQVLGVCSKLISKCKPLMIVFIGDMYGSTVDERVITPEFAEELNRELNTSVLRKSITALEIDFGIFQKRSSKCIICIRELRGEFSADDRKKFFEQEPDDAKKLEELTERLKREYKDRIVEYTADWDGKKLKNFLRTDGRNLAEVLLERMKEDCAADWLKYEKLSWQEQEEKAAWQLAKVRAENFYARQDIVAHFEKLFEDSDIIFLKGSKGTGKTSLLSKIAVDFQNLKRKVCCIFSGASTRSSNSLDILRQMVFFVEEVAGKEHFSATDEGDHFAAYQRRLMEICRQIAEPLFFIIDAVDQIDIDSHRTHLNFLPKATNVHCLVSGADFDFKLVQRVLGGREESFDFLKDDEVEEVLRGILKRNGRDLFTEIAVAVNKSNGKNSPLFLEFVAQIFFLLTAREFNNLDYNEVIQAAVRHVKNISSKKISDAAVYILKEAANIIFEKPEKAIAAVRLLAISPHGLRRSDLESILKLNTLDYARLIWYLHTFFFKRQSGAIDFNHSLIRDGILNDIDKNYIDEGEHQITAHIKKNLPAQDWLRCLDGATFAQKTHDYGFLATLYGEAFIDKNSLLIYGIAQALRSDSGTTCINLLKNHWDELSDETAGGCYAFFKSITFPDMLAGSYEDYEITRKIIIALPILSKSVFIEFSKKDFTGCIDNLTDFDMTLVNMDTKYLIARQEFICGNLPKAQDYLEEIIQWGEKHTSAKRTDLVGIMCSAYDTLNLLYLTLSNKKVSLEKLQRQLFWAKRGVELLEELNLNTKKRIPIMFSLANAYSLTATIKISLNVDNLSLEECLDYQAQAYEIYSELIILSSNPKIFQSATRNVFELAKVNAHLGRIYIVESFLEECEEKIEILLSFYSYDLGSFEIAGEIYSRMSFWEMAIGKIEKSYAHVEKLIRLFFNIRKSDINSAKVIEKLLLILPIKFKNMAGDFEKIGDRERAAHCRKIAAEILRRMSKL